MSIPVCVSSVYVVYKNAFEGHSIVTVNHCTFSELADVLCFNGKGPKKPRNISDKIE